VNRQKIPGVLVKSWNFNSTCVLLIFVKSIENRRNIRKIQTQFCWIFREKSYNFCYSCLS
jgi:hypothetical protein